MNSSKTCESIWESGTIGYTLSITELGSGVIMSLQLPADSTQSSTPFDPRSVQYFELVNTQLKFTTEELHLLERNGFLVSDRLSFDQFKRAYAYIYWKDLPVFVSTDSILHAVHQTYDKLLAEIEMTVLTLSLRDMLLAVREHVRQDAPSHQRGKLAPLFQDLDTYLSVAIELLKGRSGTDAKQLTRKAAHYIRLIRIINSDGYHRSRETLTIKNGKLKIVKVSRIGTEHVTFFGLKRAIDFTQFQARGHYDEPHQLCAYFTAMMWLGLLDFRFVDYSVTGEPVLHIGQLAAAHILRDALDSTGQRTNWNLVDNLLRAFIGWSDNVTLNGLDAIIQDAGITSPADYFTADPHELLHLLTSNDYGNQKIRGQVQYRNTGANSSLAHPVSFTLIGQRFTLESYVMGELVYDKLVVDGTIIPRAYPSPLDVMAVLGNDRAVEHLQNEFSRYGYRQRMLDLRQDVATTSTEFWGSSFYNLWLNSIRSLNVSTNDPHYPTPMHSPAWQDKALHTQLASWTQLRHDNILYVKPPYSPRAVCEYPAGYVEPCPEFYKAIGEYARFGQHVFHQLDDAMLQQPISEEPSDNSPKLSWEGDKLSQRAIEVIRTARKYFADLEVVASTLETIAHKQMLNEFLSDEENLFLRSIVVRKYAGEQGYGGYMEEHWDGWYNDILPFGDQSPLLVTDVYTNTEPSIGAPGVLHLGLGVPVAIVFLAETNNGTAMYVGPAFTLYEHLEEGSPPKRLTDEDWWGVYTRRGRYEVDSYKKTLQKATLSQNTRQQLEHYLQQAIETYETDLLHPPPPPTWTSSFRLFHRDPVHLHVPDGWEFLGIDVQMQSELSQHLKITSIEELRKVVLTHPRDLLAVPALDEERLDNLIQRMRRAGYLNKSD
jgi:hypothetical protein